MVVVDASALTRDSALSSPPVRPREEPLELPRTAGGSAGTADPTRTRRRVVWATPDADALDPPPLRMFRGATPIDAALSGGAGPDCPVSSRWVRGASRAPRVRPCGPSSDDSSDPSPRMSEGSVLALVRAGVRSAVIGDSRSTPRRCDTEGNADPRPPRALLCMCIGSLGRARALCGRSVLRGAGDVPWLAGVSRLDKGAAAGSRARSERAGMRRLRSSFHDAAGTPYAWNS